MKAGPDDEMDTHTGEPLRTLDAQDHTLGHDASEESMARIKDEKEEMNENDGL